ncbi:hypothetical protein CIT292_07109 [Citrobacter youngae ATCC 29220]|uniref:Uncharacterized protein n=1 Tax=Citrobacter youngae ATCC 29220 TaxID=500640 RepID=D4B9G9_9ENTR|nr:hypothetical protein CIT292_07109 [Citrobacter youngae ATCC 29220]
MVAVGLNKNSNKFIAGSDVGLISAAPSGNNSAGWWLTPYPAYKTAWHSMEQEKCHE